MRVEDLTVEVRDVNLRRMGSIPRGIMDFNFTDVHLGVGKWTITLPSEHPLAAILRTKGSGALFRVRGRSVLTGPTMTHTDKATSTDPRGLTVFSGVSDNILLKHKVSLPDPDHEADAQTKAYDIRVGVGETVMRQYVDKNLGPGALMTRRGLLDQKLLLDPDLGRGGTVYKKPRFQTMLELLGEIGITSGLGFRVIQRGANLVFEVYEVRDRTGFVRFSVKNNTLTEETAQLSAPQITQVYVLGQGDLEEREVLRRTNATALADAADFGFFIEYVKDQRQASETSALTQAADEDLASFGFTSSSFSAVPTDDQSMKYVNDWYLGDEVTANVRGTEINVTVAEMSLVANEKGVSLAVGLGSPTLPSAGTLTSRVSNLERNELSANSAVLLAAGTDLNALVTPGVYAQGTPSECTLAHHYPVDQHTGTLEVFAWAGPTFSVVEHRYTTYRGATPTIPNGAADAIWTRGWSSNSNTWTEWRTSTPSHAYDNSYRQSLASLRKVTPYSPMEVTRGDNGERSHSSDGIMWDRVMPEAPPFIRPTMTSSWVDYNTQYHHCGYLKTSQEIVALSGLIRSGSVGAGETIFTLPVGYRPDSKLMFPILANGAMGRIEILTDGRVVPSGGDAAWFSLDGIMFPAAGVATWTTVAAAGTGGGVAAFATGWASYHTIDATWPAFAYWQDPLGRIWFRGLTRQLTPSTLISDSNMFTLPVLTTKQTHFPGIASGGFGSFHYLGPSGTTTVAAKSGTGTTWCSLQFAPMVNNSVRNDWFEIRQHYGTWVRYAASFPDHSFLKFSDGIVYMDGLVKDGALGTTASGIPERFQPDSKTGTGDTSGRIIMFANANNGLARADLGNDLGFGPPIIVPNNGSTTWQSHAFRYVRGGS